MSDYLSRYYNLRVFLFWHTWVRPAVSSPFLLTVNKREPTWNANADKKKFFKASATACVGSTCHAFKVTESMLVALALPMLKVVWITKTSETNCRHRFLPAGYYLFFTLWLPLPLLPVFFFSFVSLLSAMQLWGITGSSWCERRGRSSQSESVTSACRMRASTPARSSPCLSRPQRPFSPYWVSVIHRTWLIRILVPGALARKKVGQDHSKTQDLFSKKFKHHQVCII